MENRLGLQCTIERDVLPRLVGNEFADAITEGVAHVHHAAHVAHCRARSHGPKGGDLAHSILAVFGFHIVDHAVAVGLAKIDIEVGHRNAVWIQETLKQQLVLQRIQISDLQGIRHQRARARAPPWPHRATVALGPLNEVTHNEKVARKAHFDNRANLKLQTLQIDRHLKSTLRRIWVEHRHALFQALMRSMAKVFLGCQLLAIDKRRGEMGQFGFTQFQDHTATLGNLQRISQSTGQICKKLGHFKRRFEILLPRELAHAPRITQNLTLRNTDARLMRFVILSPQKLHRMRGHHR